MDFHECKRQQEQQHSAKSSRSPSPDLEPASPAESETFHPVQRTPPPSRVGPPPSPPVPTTPIVPVAPEPPGPLSLLPCQVCGRTFVQQSLAKHIKICEKMTVKKRKTFDSSRQRREGTDLEQYLPKNFGLPENSPFLEKSPPQVVKATLKPKVQSVRSAIMKPTADLQKCPHCNRAFGVRAFERHVEWCADKAKILPAAPAQPPPHIADAKQRLNARTQYKAPPVRGRRSSQSRDKSSLSRSTSVESTRGVSPAPPREYGDYRHGRTRASESLSSNDCIDDSPHIPVIRNSRAPQTNSSGDANVKARQARLARDLSNSRRQEWTKASSIQLSTAPGPSKLVKNDKIKLDIKKRQQLKKLDEIANKYKEREKVKENVKSNSRNKKNVVTKSQIPLPKNHEITETKTCIDNIQKKTNIRGPTNMKRMRDLKCDKKDMDKESTMSLDSLDEINVNKNSSKDIRADILCPCVPCVIHENNEPISNVARKKTNTVKEFNKELLNSDAPQKIRVLFKNLKFLSDKEKTETIKFKASVEKNKKPINTESKLVPCHYNNSIENQRIKGEVKLDPQFKGDLLVKTSTADFNHTVDGLNKEYTAIETSDYENINYLDSRHGSGETYTKFSENPADLDEFFMITDEMINKKQHDDLNNNIAHLEKDVDTLHTPQTDSLETLNTDLISNEDIFITKQEFSNALGDLKKDFKNLMLEVNTDSLPPVSKKPDYKSPVAEIKKDNVSIKNIDLEHITVYEFKHKKISENGTDEENSKLKLPSINDSKKNTKHTSNRNKGFKGSRKIKMLSLQKRTSKNYQTFIIKNDDTTESNDDAPPLKLPRIENNRLDDNYDPFVSAAKQMKELMSSDKSIPRKANNNPKGNTNTLPNLKQAKDKMSLSHPRPDNTKMMKDTINKTYQKTPTLQRMKSFGSSNIDKNNSFGGRCSSFRVNRNDKKPSQNLNSTFTKTSKENIISADKTYFNRNSSMNRSFSSYSNSSYSTPKLKDKIPKLSQSMHHGFQRNTIKQPLKLDKINKNEEKPDPITLGSIFSYDNGSSMTDSNYIDPRLINENDNLPINVNTILNNPDIISSMESLLTTENLPAKFESFSAARNNLDNNMSQSLTNTDEKNNNINNIISPTISDLSSRYDKIMSSLEQSVTSKTSARDDDSLCEDFDLEEFMTSFDEEIHKQKIESKRTYSSTTRIVAHSEICDDGRKSGTKVVNSPKIVNGSNGMIPVNKSTSLVFSSNNITGEKFFPSSVKRSTSLLDSIQKKTTKTETSKSRQSVDKLEDDIMQSLKDFDKFYASQKNDNGQMNKEMSSSNKRLYHDTIKREVKKKNEPKAKTNKASNGNCTPNGKSSNDSAYSRLVSLNRISPSKLSLCKETNVVASLSRIPAGSDTSSGHKDDLQSISSDEFLAMERTAELTVTEQSDVFNDLGTKVDKNTKSRESSRASPTWRRKETLSSSGSESSLYRTTKESSPAPRLSRFCHECGSKFPVDTAKFCIECGVKRLVV